MPTTTVPEPRVQAEIQVFDSTKAPYMSASELKKAKRPKQMSRYRAIRRSCSLSGVSDTKYTMKKTQIKAKRLTKRPRIPL